jgi:hypothetical protein
MSSMQRALSAGETLLARPGAQTPAKRRPTMVVNNVPNNAAKHTFRAFRPKWADVAETVPLWSSSDGVMLGVDGPGE